MLAVGCGDVDCSAACGSDERVTLVCLWYAVMAVEVVLVVVAGAGAV